MIAVLALAAGLSACPVEPMTKEGVLAAERDWVDAIEKGDRVRLACRLAPGFTDSNWQGALNSRAETLAGMTGPRPRLSLSALQVERMGPTAIVHGLNRQTRVDGTDQGTVRFTDIFSYRAGRWQAISAQETPVRK